MRPADPRPTVNFPKHYLPGTTDNFVSNEVYVTGLTASEVWPLLVVPERWASYYDGATDIVFPDNDGPELREGTRLWFAPFNLAPLHSVINELVSPRNGRPGRLSWTGQMKQDGTQLIDVLHGFLVEDLPRRTAAAADPGVRDRPGRQAGRRRALGLAARRAPVLAGGARERRPLGRIEEHLTPAGRVLGRAAAAGHPVSPAPPSGRARGRRSIFQPAPFRPTQWSSSCLSSA
jgi:hypothetical protein